MHANQPDSEEINDEAYKQLTAEEALTLQSSFRAMSPWRIIGWQALVGLGLTLLGWAVASSAAVTWSVAYGALCVVVPALVFARGLQRQQRAAHVGAALGGFFVWEMVKVVLTVAMLFAAPRLVEGLNWLALLAGFVVTMKVYWVAMWLHSTRSKSVAKI